MSRVCDVHGDDLRYVSMRFTSGDPPYLQCCSCDGWVGNMFAANLFHKNHKKKPKNPHLNLTPPMPAAKLERHALEGERVAVVLVELFQHAVGRRVHVQLPRVLEEAERVPSK